jgi:hypothetical protein
MQLGDETGIYYRGKPEHEYRIAMVKDGIHVYVSTNGGFPIYQITENPFMSYHEALEHLKKHLKQYDECICDGIE